MIVIALAMAQLSMASNLSFLNDSVVSKFKKQDLQLLMASVDKVLDSPEPRASGNWSNAKTGNSGEVVVTGQFTATDGHACKNVNVLNRTATMQGKADYILCQVPGRGWLLNPQARPAPGDAPASR
ncbi:MAG: DVU3141 family protein [Pseudomonadota bacterium]